VSYSDWLFIISGPEVKPYRKKEKEEKHQKDLVANAFLE